LLVCCSTDVSMESVQSSINRETDMITRAPSRFRAKPARAISLMRIFPLPKTMALGAVATGLLPGL